MAEQEVQSRTGPEAQLQVFRATSGLKFSLGFAFFLAVLFAVNAIVGSIWLARHNLWLDAVIFLVLFGAGCWLVFFAAAFLFSASNTEIKLGRDSLEMLIPNWRGPTPYIPYSRIALPYKDIAAIETRGEIYKYYVLPIASRCLTLVRKDGRRYHIGYTRENASENAFPYDELAKELGKRTGLPIIDKGIVKGGTRLRALLHDAPPLDAPVIAEAEAKALMAEEGKAWKMALAAIAIIMAGGFLFQGISLAAAAFSGTKHAASTHRSNR
jgi:hypothetical protein